MSTELVLDHDPATWVLLDPEDADPEEWALDQAERCFAETGVAPDPDDVTRLSTVLLQAWQSVAELAGFLLLHLPHPYGDAGPIAHLTAIDASDGTPEALRALAGADDEDLAEPAVVDWFETPIGAALRCRRYPTRPASGPRFLRRAATVSMAVTYVWHLPSLDADVRLACVSSDVGQLTSVLDDVDELARSVVVEEVEDAG